MKHLILTLALLTLVILPARAADFDFHKFGQIPVLHEGRIKPIDTFARSHLLVFNGKQKTKEQTAVEWLAELLFNSSKAMNRKIFNISNPEVVGMLGLKWDTKHRYDFNQVALSLRKNIDTIEQLYKMDRDDQSPTQKYLVGLYTRALRFHELSRSLSLLLPIFGVDNENVAQELGIEKNKRYTYMEMQRIRRVVDEKVPDYRKKKFNELTAEEKSMLILAFNLHNIQQDTRTNIFRVMPPQWEDNADVWMSPWQLIQSGRGSPKTAKLFALWRSLADAFEQKDQEKWDQQTALLATYSQKIAKTKISANMLTLEQNYNKWDLFTNSLALYILSFLTLVASWVWAPKWLYRISFGALALGGLVHFTGVLLRIIIMNRPPVSTLYESIIFVALVGVIFGLVLEWVRRNGLGILLASLIGIILSFVGFGYADDGDTMGMLVAVLNTNFWLATHVVCITIGYGCCFVGGMFGHIYLVQAIIDPKSKKLPDIYQNMVGVSLFALFFAMFGTILGGIWADQSWGRFWGWDPKENGAMLIVLWLLFLLHGRISGKLGALGYAFGMVGTNVIVAIAWFGVNLLNVGLHSYGFTDNIANNLALFCGTEILFGAAAYGWVYYHKNRTARSR